MNFSVFFYCLYVICEGSPGVGILKGVVCQCTSNVCDAEGNKAKYVGETARSMYERIQEHKNL